MPRRLETDLAPNVVGELIASEIEVRTGRCEDFGEAAAAMEERRGQLHGVARELQIALGGTGTHPWSRWQDQRIIDTPHYRRNDELLRYVVWRNNTFGLHVHVGIAGADRAIAVHDALRNFLPELLALSASSPFVEAVNSGLHSARTEIFTRMFPRCGIPDAVRRAGAAGRTTSRSSTGPARSPSTRRSGGAFARTSPTRRSRSGSATAQPDLAEAQSLAALCYALAARCARAYDEGEPLPEPAAPPARGEPVAGDPLRPVGRAARLRRAASRFPRGRGIEQLIEWVAPVADEIGAAPYLAVPARNAAERQIARFEEGARLEEIYAEQVRGGRAESRWLTSRRRRSTRGAAGAARGVRRRAVPRLGRLDDREPGLREARTAATSTRRGKAIDALAALVPLLEGELKRDLDPALANLQVAYASRQAA